MSRIIAALIIAGVVMAAVKLAIIGLVVAGLLFRTRETLGLIAACAIWTLFWQAPVIGCALIGGVFVAAAYKALRKNYTANPVLKLTDQTRS